MLEKLKPAWTLTKSTFQEFFDDRPMDYAAIIGFYTIFSLPAVLIITIRIAGAAFGQEAVKGEVVRQIGGIVGQNSAEQIQVIIENASQSESSTIGTVVGIATMVFAATTVFVAMQNSINSIWNVKAKPEKGWLKLIIDRVLSLAMVVSLGFLLLVSLSVDIVLGVVNEYLRQELSGLAVYLMNIAHMLVSILISVAIFSVMFKMLPDADIRWRNVWVGAIVTAVLFAIGKYVLNVYFQYNSMSDTYGAAGSMVLILVWVYYSSIILLLGAEFTQVYSRMHDKGIRPSDHAVKVETKEIESDE
ncbi:YihY/virulence factor BrkB family protein [Pontibacter sp. SGAir0037]|uniref:YihY/virulence factor BrkB family protein n=1 Tax=Pontibacter sp. SGAir0037 TaxID=2571030 RepID=UPI0010CCC7AE|nr:YihY/virulence factor BrkB family protein [Pontibacter sp. SGAir0037]QCR22679.1 ribonuclease BN [Pontibacter sp. SGAir0037]